MNNKVTVTGMEVRAHVNNNLLISETNSESTFVTAITQSRDADLEPVSTINGKAFFYTTDARGDGSKIHLPTGTDAVPYVAYSESGTIDAGWTNAIADAAAAGKGTAYDAAFNTAYGHTLTATSTEVYYGYVDYVFYLKATSTKNDSQIIMDKCNLLYNNAAITAGGDQGWRVAVFSDTVAAGVSTSSETLKSILGLSGKDYFTDNTGVKSTTELDSVSNLGTAVVIDNDIDSGVTRYYRVVVRLWLEGEDEDCFNEMYATKTDDWKLDLSFTIQDDATGAVTAIGSSTT